MNIHKKVHPRPSTCMIESPEDLNSLAELKINQAAHMDNITEADKLSDEGWALKNAAKDWRLVSESAIYLRRNCHEQKQRIRCLEEDKVTLINDNAHFQKEAVKFSTLYSREISRAKKWLIVDVVLYSCFAILLWIAA